MPHTPDRSRRSLVKHSAWTVPGIIMAITPAQASTSGGTVVITCASLNQVCTPAKNCCPGLQCDSGVCVEPVGCFAQNAICSSSSECCSGNCESLGFFSICQ